MNHKITQTEKKLFSVAQKLSKEGDLEGAVSVMEELVSESDSEIFLAVLGNLYWETKKFELAIEFLKKAIKQKPDFEKASLALFHCFLELDRQNEAFDEMRRFLAIRESKEYRALLDKINSD